MSLDKFRHHVNHLVHAHEPFLFMVDFEMKNPWVCPLADIDPSVVLFDINGKTNAPARTRGNHGVELKPKPISFESYAEKFSMVMKGLSYGDSFLTNLTIRTPLEASLDLKHIFFQTSARYKLWFNERFLVFSPEPFFKTANGWIFSYPMKGTIDASMPRAAERILGDQKEMSEHVTIVDLIRNDLSMVAKHVEVRKFRYVESIHSKGKTLLQVSSEIAGELDTVFRVDPGGALLSLLPAGSVSGAPKQKTVELIRSAEGEDRGFYTGICGIFDGQDFDTGVMIRFIEEKQKRYFYRSGGGITTMSNPLSEYQEALDKIYAPID